MLKTKLLYIPIADRITTHGTIKCFEMTQKKLITTLLCNVLSMFNIFTTLVGICCFCFIKSLFIVLPCKVLILYRAITEYDIPLTFYKSDDCIK